MRGPWHFWIEVNVYILPCFPTWCNLSRHVSVHDVSCLPLEVESPFHLCPIFSAPRNFLETDYITLKNMTPICHPMEIWVDIFISKQKYAFHFLTMHQGSICIRGLLCKSMKLADWFLSMHEACWLIFAYALLPSTIDLLVFCDFCQNEYRRFNRFTYSIFLKFPTRSPSSAFHTSSIWSLYVVFLD